MEIHRYNKNIIEIDAYQKGVKTKSKKKKIIIIISGDAERQR